MSSDGRSRRRERVEEAYQLQVKAGLMARHIPLTDPHDKSTVSFIGIHVSACTGSGAIWRLWPRLCNFRASYLACFPVSFRQHRL